MYLESATDPADAPAAPERSSRHRDTEDANAVRVEFADMFDPARAGLEQFVRASYETAYGARLQRLMPQLMGVRNARDEVIAVCGLRDPRTGPLFLESYLDRPVETVLERAAGEAVSRGSLNEVGNLAIARPGFARYLIAALTSHLHETGRRWAVFTAVPTLRNAFSRLGIELLTLGPARIGCIPARERAQWGSYYDQRPLVMAAGVAQSLGALGRARLLPMQP